MKLVNESAPLDSYEPINGRVWTRMILESPKISQLKRRVLRLRQSVDSLKNRLGSAFATVASPGVPTASSRQIGGHLIRLSQKHAAVDLKRVDALQIDLSHMLLTRNYSSRSAMSDSLELSKQLLILKSENFADELMSLRDSFERDVRGGPISCKPAQRIGALIHKLHVKAVEEQFAECVSKLRSIQLHTQRIIELMTESDVFLAGCSVDSGKLCRISHDS